MRLEGFVNNSDEVANATHATNEFCRQPSGQEAIDYAQLFGSVLLTAFISLSPFVHPPISIPIFQSIRTSTRKSINMFEFHLLSFTFVYLSVCLSCLFIRWCGRLSLCECSNDRKEKQNRFLLLSRSQATDRTFQKTIFHDEKLRADF